MSGDQASELDAWPESQVSPDQYPTAYGATVTHLSVPALEVSPTDWENLSMVAWRVAERAVARNTAVGAAVLSSGGLISAGCNVEHKLRCHDIHAEVSALSRMVAEGGRAARAILVVSTGRELSPCGGCMDWIFQLGGASCLIAWQGHPDEEISPRRAEELMPHYPI